MLTASDWWTSHTTKWRVLWNPELWQEHHSFKRMWGRSLPQVGQLSWKVAHLQVVFFTYLFILQAALGLSCGWRDLDPWWGTELGHPQPPPHRAQSLTRWTTSEVPKGCVIYVTALYLASCFLWNHSTCLADLLLSCPKCFFISNISAACDILKLYSQSWFPSTPTVHQIATDLSLGRCKHLSI